MTFRHRLILALAAIHLAVVICGAAECLPNIDGGTAPHVVQWYAKMSGASSNYGFFSPNVGSLHRARFILQDAAGTSWEDSFDKAQRNEARLRLTGIVDAAFLTGAVIKFPEWRSQLLRSWGATIFERNPNAVSQTVIIEVYDIPTMARYRAGARPAWRVVYQAELQRDSWNREGTDEN